MSDEDVDRRAVLVGLGVAVVAGIGGFVGFRVAGPARADDDDTRRDDDRHHDDAPEDERDDDPGYGSAPGPGAHGGTA